MDRNFKRSLELVLRFEGGYVNNPKDPGGATNKGVTLATFRRYVKPAGTIKDLKALTDDQAGVVYRRQYWDAVVGAELPDGIDYAVFDLAVNSGVGRAARFLQTIVGAVQDGKIGSATLKAARALPRQQVINALCDKRLAFLHGLSTWPVFGKGWASRVKSVRAAALKMAAV